MTVGRSLVLAGVAVASVACGAGADEAKKKGPAIPWITSLQEGLEACRATGRPVLLDFWCGT